VVPVAGAFCFSLAAGESAACAKFCSGQSAKSATARNASAEGANSVEQVDRVDRDESFMTASAGGVQICARHACTGLNGVAEISCAVRNERRPRNCATAGRQAKFRPVCTTGPHPSPLARVFLGSADYTRLIATCAGSVDSRRLIVGAADSNGLQVMHNQRLNKK